MRNKANTGTVLRTGATWEAYKNSPKRGSAKCFMCDYFDLPIVKAFNYWLIVENQFPYDAVSVIHHMLIPRRHFARHMNGEELREFVTIKKRLAADGEYDCILENFPIGQSHPSHLHFQLLQWKRTE